MGWPHCPPLQMRAGEAIAENICDMVSMVPPSLLPAAHCCWSLSVRVIARLR